MVEKCVDNELIDNFEIVNYPGLKTIFLLSYSLTTVSSLLLVKGLGHSENIEYASTYQLHKWARVVGKDDISKNNNLGLLL